MKNNLKNLNYLIINLYQIYIYDKIFHIYIMYTSYIVGDEIPNHDQHESAFNFPRSFGIGINHNPKHSCSRQRKIPIKIILNDDEEVITSNSENHSVETEDNSLYFNKSFNYSNLSDFSKFQKMSSIHSLPSFSSNSSNFIGI